MTKRESGWLAGLVILSILALVELFYIPGRNQWLEEVNNAGHLLIFGILAVAMLHLVKLARPSLRQHPLKEYAAAFVLASGLGAASELVQYFGPRDASFVDLARDLLGAASFLALYAAIRDPDLRRVATPGSGLRRRLLLCTIVLWLVGGWSLLAWSVAFAHRNLTFPVVCDFSSWLSTRFLESNAVILDFGVESDSAGIPCEGTRVHFLGTEWPGVIIAGVYPDWRHRDSLLLDLCVEGTETLRLGLAVADRQHNQEPNDRFSVRVNVDPGKQHVGVSLGNIILGPVKRRLDVSQVDVVMIFTETGGLGQSVLLERLYLK